jgi:hypothetical protein
MAACVLCSQLRAVTRAAVVRKPAAAMSSSVASGKVMERWARERDEQKNPRVHMPKAAQDTFNAMKPDFAALEKFEQKREQVIDRLTERENGLEVEEVINVMGSTAGAGSGCGPSHRHHRHPPTLRRRPDTRGILRWPP